MKTNTPDLRTLTSLFFLALVIVTTNVSKANSVTWIGGHGSTPNSWKDANNWNSGSNPGSQDDVTIPATSYNPTMDATSSINSLTINGSGAILTLDGTHNLIVIGNVNVSTSGAQLATGKGTIIIGGSISGLGKLDLTGNGTAQIAGNMSVSTFTCGSGGKSTIILNGALQNVTNSYQFNNLQIGTAATTSVNFLADEVVNVALGGFGVLNCGNHILNLIGDMTVKTFYADSGTVNLTGFINSQSQDINGYTFYNLSVDNTKTYLAGNVCILHNLNFISGDILLRSYNLTILSGATITWSGSLLPDYTSGYVVTCGSGHLTMTATTSGSVFPIGYSMSEYNPITLKNPSGSVVCDASVSDGVTDVVGNAMTSNAVNETWLIVPHTNATSIIVMPQWTNGSHGAIDQELPFFNRAFSEVNERTSRSDPSPWTTIGLAGQAIGEDPWSSTGSVSMIANTTYYLYIGAGSIAPLPVTLTTFDTEYKDGIVSLKWITASEINNNRFEIERSTNGTTWTTIGNVEGHGSTQEENAYLATDNLEGFVSGITIYYRLKQVDFNGDFTFSMIRSVNIQDIPISIEMYPNPVHDNLNINLTSREATNTIIRIINTNGVLVYNEELTGQGILHKQINIAGYPSGNYMLEIIGDARITSKQIIKE